MPHSSQDVRNKILGRKGEKLTRRYLRLHGYKIIASNYATPFGEADIVAQKGDIYCFVEVKARTGDVLALPSFPSLRVEMVAAGRTGDRVLSF